MSQANTAQNASADAIAAWEEVRADSSIQFETPPPPEPPEPPEPPPQWLQDLGQWFSDLFQPLGNLFGTSWPVLQYLLIAALAVGVLLLVYFIARNIIADRRTQDDEPVDTGWRPDTATARALLQEADALAAEGNYAEAIRLILWRSIEDITKAEPRAIMPSNTAREIGRFTILSDHARQVFTMIAGHVERGIFAGQAVDESAWREARHAYDGFAMGGAAK